MCCFAEPAGRLIFLDRQRSGRDQGLFLVKTDVIGDIMLGNDMLDAIPGVVERRRLVDLLLTAANNEDIGVSTFPNPNDIPLTLPGRGSGGPSLTGWIRILVNFYRKESLQTAVSGSSSVPHQGSRLQPLR